MHTASTVPYRYQDATAVYSAHLQVSQHATADLTAALLQLPAAGVAAAATCCHTLLLRPFEGRASQLPATSATMLSQRCCKKRDSTSNEQRSRGTLCGQLQQGCKSKCRQQCIAVLVHCFALCIATPAMSYMKHYSAPKKVSQCTCNASLPCSAGGCYAPHTGTPNATP